MKNKNVTTLLRHFFITTAIIFICTLVSLFFVELHIRTENIIMIYLLGVLFIVIETKQLVWGIASSFISIITFNYCFTQPLYSLHIHDPNYIITIIIFLIVSIITNILMGKLQKHAAIARYNEQQTLAFYEISKSFLNLSGIQTIFMHTIHALYENQNIISVLYYYDEKSKQLQRYQDAAMPLALHVVDELAAWCYKHQKVCGHATAINGNEQWSYHPLCHGEEILGVYAISHTPELTKENELFIHTLIAQMVMALEREQLYAQQEQSRIAIEKEKLRNNLLRSLSHDLRTLLTNIAGSSAVLLENDDVFDSGMKKKLMKSISNDAQWLTQLVENLLNMTRIQDGRLLLSKHYEVVDDIICEALQRCESRKGSHTLSAHLPETIQLVNMDGQLIIQVLVNFIDNAIKHTQPTSHIDIYYTQKKGKACFEVSDDGNGIPDNIIDTLFDSFVTTKSERSDAKRGVGLGLSISKAIIEAHGGTIYAHNRADGHGAILGFYL